jgi:hypothetical protein
VIASMPITPQTIVQRRRDALAAEVGGELVLMSVEHGKYYGLDDVGSDVWRRIEQPIAVEQLCAELAREYRGDPSAIERDVVALLEKFAGQDLLERSDS